MEISILGHSHRLHRCALWTHNSIIFQFQWLLRTWNWISLIGSTFFAPLSNTGFGFIYGGATFIHQEPGHQVKKNLCKCFCVERRIYCFHVEFGVCQRICEFTCLTSQARKLLRKQLRRERSRCVFSSWFDFSDSSVLLFSRTIQPNCFQTANQSTMRSMTRRSQ